MEKRTKHTSNTNNNALRQAEVMDLYKMHAGLADRVTQRRNNSNNLYTLTNVALAFASLAAMATAPWATVPILVMGAILCTVWAGIIRSAKKLNTAKFKVFNEMEAKGLPVKFFTEEYRHYKKDKRKDFTDIEALLPYLFFNLHAGICAASFFVG